MPSYISTTSFTIDRKKRYQKESNHGKDMIQVRSNIILPTQKSMGSIKFRFALFHNSLAFFLGLSEDLSQIFNHGSTKLEFCSNDCSSGLEDTGSLGVVVFFFPCLENEFTTLAYDNEWVSG